MDYTQPFNGSDHAAWEEEYQDNVRTLIEPPSPLDFDLTGDGPLDLEHLHLCGMLEFHPREETL